MDNEHNEAAEGWADQAVKLQWENAKLRAEVKLSHTNLKIFRDNLARVGKEKKVAELQNSELISLLRKIEWVTDGYSGVKICPCCEQDKRHNPGCKLDELIRKTNDSCITINYRQLLSKYLDHVGDCEGVTFIHNIGGSRVAFSDEEVAELRAIDKELKKKS